MSAVLAWVPFIGSVIACVIVVLVAATDFPDEPVGRVCRNHALSSSCGCSTISCSCR
jgi:hypothetical protein